MHGFNLLLLITPMQKNVEHKQEALTSTAIH